MICVALMTNRRAVQVPGATGLHHLIVYMFIFATEFANYTEANIQHYGS